MSDFTPETNSSIDDHLTCYYCHLRHKQVEAGGVWHCPNPLCTGPGGAYFRSKLTSYKEVENARHTVDYAEWLNASIDKLMNEDLDEVLQEKIILDATDFIEKLEPDSKIPCVALMQRLLKKS
jgi:hypothetical protein